MNISVQDEGKLVIKAIRRRLYGNRFDEEIEKADKEELFYENLHLRQENEQLRKSQFIKTQLIIEEENSKYIILEFIDSKKHSKKGKIMKISSQYTILWCFIHDSEVHLRTQDLIQALRPIKSHLNNVNSKKRVLDAIQELRSKFGNEIILKKRNGFLFFSNITKYPN